MLWLFKFFTGSILGRIAGYALLALTLIGMLKIAIWQHDRTLEAKTLAEFNRHQLEQVAKDQLELNKKLGELKEIQIQIQTDLAAKQTDISRVADALEKSLNNDPKLTGRDSSLSPYLQETVKQLGKWKVDK